MFYYIFWLRTVLLIEERKKEKKKERKKKRKKESQTEQANVAFWASVSLKSPNMTPKIYFGAEPKFGGYPDSIFVKFNDEYLSEGIAEFHIFSFSFFCYK